MQQISPVDSVTQLEIVAASFIELQDEKAVAARLGMPETLVKGLLASREAHVMIIHILQANIIALAIPAVETLKTIMASGDLGKGWQIKLNAAKTVLDRVGLIPPKASDPERGKGLEDMSRDELHKTIRQAERVLGDRATPITPVSPSHVSDILD